LIVAASRNIVKNIILEAKKPCFLQLMFCTIKVNGRVIFMGVTVSLKNITYLLLITLITVSTQNAMLSDFSENDQDEGFGVLEEDVPLIAVDFGTGEPNMANAAFEDDDPDSIRFEGYLGDWKNEYGENVPHVEGEDLARSQRVYQAEIDRLESELADYSRQDLENFVGMLDRSPEAVLLEDQSYDHYRWLQNILREQRNDLDELDQSEKLQACQIVRQYVDLLDIRKRLKDLRWWTLQEQILRYADTPPSDEEHMAGNGLRGLGQRLDVAAERDAALAALGLTYDARLTNKSLIQQQADILKGQIRARYLAERNRSFTALSELVGKKRDEYIQNMILGNPYNKALWDRLYQEEQETKSNVDQAAQMLISKYFPN